MFTLRLFRKAFLSCAALLLLGSCAWLAEDSVQKISFVTPGAQDTVCFVYIGGLRYRVRPPQTTSVYNSKSTMTVDCLAPGNRRRKVYIEPVLAESAKWNLANGGTGYAYDYVSGALFKYPPQISVDFTGAPVSDFPPPAQNNPDIRQPEDYPLEEFRPMQPRLNSDQTEEPVRILRRGEDPYGAPYADAYDPGLKEPPAQDKGDLMEVRPSSDSGPLQIVPGQ